MSAGLILRGGVAVAVLLAAATASAMPAGPWSPASHPFSKTLQVQAEPPAAPETTPPPDAVTPPPILPAPHMPGENPVVTLPPREETKKDAANPVVPAPGIPVTADGTVFSFADLAEQLLDSVVYISTSQRVAISPRTPKPDAAGHASGR